MLRFEVLMIIMVFMLVGVSLVLFSVLWVSWMIRVWVFFRNILFFLVKLCGLRYYVSGCERVWCLICVLVNMLSMCWCLFMCGKRVWVVVCILF